MRQIELFDSSKGLRLSDRLQNLETKGTFDIVFLTDPEFYKIGIVRDAAAQLVDCNLLLKCSFVLHQIDICEACYLTVSIKDCLKCCGFKFALH